MHPLKKLLGYARQYRRDIRIATVYSVLNKFFDILPEVLIGAAVDVVVRGDQSFLARNIFVDFGIVSTWHQLLVLGVFNVVIWGGESIFEYLYHLKWRGLAQDIQHDLRLDTYRHVQKLEMAYFESQRTGNLMSILNDDINQMERFLNGGANQIIQVFCSSLMISAVFFSLQPAIALIALLPVPAILLGAFWFQKRLAPRYAEVRAAAGDVSAKLNNNLLGLATIKAFATESVEAGHIAQASDGYRKAYTRAIRLSSAITPRIRTAILAGFTATLLYGDVIPPVGGDTRAVLAGLAGPSEATVDGFSWVKIEEQVGAVADDAACRQAPGGRQVSENNALRIESCWSGLRPQRMRTGTSCTSTCGSATAWPSRLASKGE